MYKIMKNTLKFTNCFLWANWEKKKKILYKQWMVRCSFKAFGSSPWSTPSSSSSSATSSPSASPPSSHCFSLLGLDLWLDVDQQGVQREAVRQDKIADVVATDTQWLQLSGFPVFQGHFHRLQVGVHAHINTCDGAVDLGAVLQLDGNRLMAELHQKPD